MDIESTWLIIYYDDNNTWKAKLLDKATAKGVEIVLDLMQERGAMITAAIQLHKHQTDSNIIPAYRILMPGDETNRPIGELEMLIDNNGGDLCL